MATEAGAADWGFSKGAAAGIIIGAVIFGLLAGVATGFAVIRCYTIYTTINNGHHLRDLWGFRWMGRLQDRHQLRRQRQVTLENNQAEPLASDTTGGKPASEDDLLLT
ncbi:g13542 [Coccomyxa viridis]|uniref:G13542 protein n=1 Tax=Coccomyxa viridis TaxID=1274662 RepID=A0ABP1GFJ2_9CHLO